MNNRETYISLIKKYLEGKLDAHAMHRLERRAQQDPFLMDAMEGYESAGKVQDSNMAELSRRLNKRTKFKEKRLIPWRYLAAAASVVLILGFGGLWLYLHQPDPAPAIAMDIAPASPAAPSPAKQIAPVRDSVKTIVKTSPVVSKQTIVQQAPQNSAAPAIAVADTNLRAYAAISPAAKMNAKQADTTPVDEMVVMGMQEQKKKTTETIVTLPDTRAAKPAARATEQMLKSKVDGASITSINERGGGSYYTSGIVQGRVIGQDDGRPMPGVSIRIKGTSIGTQTDVNGGFRLPAGAKDKTLVLGYIGYQTQEVSASKLDSSKTLAMVANNNSLSEVVVSHPDTSPGNGDSDADVSAPHPKDGWAAYNKYLNQSATSPDKKTGVVKLSFTVLPDGKIRDIHVVKGLSAGADNKAVDLISNGPAWAGSTGNKPADVNIRIKFGK